MKILCRDPVHVASMKKINEELMIFDRLIHINPRHETVETKISEILRDLWFWWKIGIPLKLLSQWGVHKYVYNFTSWFLDLQWTYVQTLWDSEQSRKKFSKNFRYIDFVITPVTFNLNFRENHDFEDLGNAVTNFVNLVCSNGPGRWVGAHGCLEHGLKSSRSNLRSKTVKMSFYRDPNLIGVLRAKLGTELSDTHESYQSSQNSDYFCTKTWFIVFQVQNLELMINIVSILSPSESYHDFG